MYRMSMWTKEKTLLLIEEIKKSNVWDIKSIEHKDSNIRNDIFAEIGKSLNCTKKEIEDKWHNVKSQFSRELAKISASIKSGCGTGDVYIPAWYAFNNLKFLKEQYQSHRSKSIDQFITQNAVKCELQSDSADDSEDVQPINDIVREHLSQLTSITTPMTQSMQAEKWRLSSNTRKRKKQENDMDNIVRNMKVVGERQPMRDEFSVYGEHVGNELRYLKHEKYRRILAETKQKINTALYEAELCRIKLDSHFSNLPLLAVTYSNPSTPLSPDSNSPTTVSTCSNSQTSTTYAMIDSPSTSNTTPTTSKWNHLF